MKSLALIMIGIITLVPILQLILEPMITPIYEFLVLLLLCSQARFFR
ncbi:MAG: hypothetical protein IKY94_02475 [Lachnospiraceae bacterium]|nr:hypothetical protein [Lachnospiraceae bacterium]